MYQTGYHATGFHATDYYLQGQVVIPPPTGGGGSGPATGHSHFNQAPDTRKNKEPLLLAQALQEDEELIIMIKAFAETITWH